MNLIPILLGFLGLFTAYLLYKVVKSYPAGDKKLTDISDEIHLGAMAFMKKEYSILFVFSLIYISHTSLHWMGNITYLFSSGFSKISLEVVSDIPCS